ncbi:MAG: YqaE/Pmp3 family membrane protein [Phycisphaeraceae bacterium]|nr:YqaE/Pmp3 family membrane protein [Phycisphaeraceae bacterium]
MRTLFCANALHVPPLAEPTHERPADKHPPDGHHRDSPPTSGGLPKEGPRHAPHISIILTLLFSVPGLIHALYVILKT